MARQDGASEDPDRGRRIGKYEILTRLSMGGMAELFLAFTSGPGGFRKFVAVKQILPDIKKDEQFVQMFLDEARITAAFSHANIGQVFDLGEDGGELFLAMEFLPGQNLEQVIKAASRRQYGLPLGFIGRVIRDTCLGLHYAHHFTDPSGRSVAVVHRDVSPKNVMLTYDGVVKVIDFGIAKARGRLGRTQVGTVKGTSGYMSPEQVRGHAMDGRSDLFSVGVMLHEMLTGQRLFNGPHEAAVMLQIVEANVTSPRAANPDIPEALDAVVMRSLARDATQRFTSGREMARAIEAALGPELFDEDGVTAVMGELFEEKRQKTRTLLELASRAEDARVSEAADELQQDDVGEMGATAQLPTPTAARTARTDGSSAPKPTPQRRTDGSSAPKPVPQRRPATPTDPEVPTRAGSGPKPMPQRRTGSEAASTTPRAPRALLEAGSTSRTPRPRPAAREEPQEDVDSLDEPSDLSTQQFRTRPPRPGAGSAGRGRGVSRSDTPVHTPAAKPKSRWMGRLFLLALLGAAGWASTQPMIRAQFVPAYESAKAWVKAELDPQAPVDPTLNAEWPPQQKPGPPPGFPGTAPAPDPRPGAQQAEAPSAPEPTAQPETPPEPPPTTPEVRPASTATVRKGKESPKEDPAQVARNAEASKPVTRKARVYAGKEKPEDEPVTTVTKDPDALAEVMDTSTPKGAAKAGLGWITLYTVPRAAVFDGATQLGTTPLLKFPLPVGTYTLRLVDPTSPDGVSRRLSAPVKPGEVTKLQIRLADLPLYKE
ncbi:protein kinase [Myxococcus sp. K38C18041901]|uniref:serine/threonine-protein kinase n=1 Tax=Myxococcus guangdongensis TaxID=2906760 RepID=UPI0020A783DE|nr:serine/threonine-protein kinase [Myxococcus guangdongensis]MCP3062557.1 protein kinase [Myxococcus guangdongensis]